MKFNPTLPLAVALSVGVAGAVMAQTANTQQPTTSPSMGYSQPAANSGQPQASSGQTQTGSDQTPSATGQTPSTTAQTQQTRPATAAPSMASGTAVNGNEQVRMAQQRLRAAGLYNGPEDGIMDPDTRAAIARYQQQNGLRPSESLDPATLASLESSGTTGSGSATPPATMPSGSAPGATPGATSNPAAGAMGGNAGKAATR